MKLSRKGLSNKYKINKMKTLTKENAETKSEISVLLFANKLSDFRKFTTLTEYMLEKYANNRINEELECIR